MKKISAEEVLGFKEAPKMCFLPFDVWNAIADSDAYQVLSSLVNAVKNGLKFTAFRRAARIAFREVQLQVLRLADKLFSTAGQKLEFYRQLRRKMPNFSLAVRLGLNRKKKSKKAKARMLRIAQTDEPV